MSSRWTDRLGQLGAASAVVGGPDLARARPAASSPTAEPPQGQRDGTPRSGRRWLTTCVLAQLVAGFALTVRYRHALTPDATAYIDIARAYADNHGWDAVNPIWSPLYSWLLALPLAAGADPLVAGQVLQVVAGAGALVGVWSLLVRVGVTDLVLAVTTAALAVVLVGWSVGGVGPDVFPVLVTVWFLRLVLDTGTARPRLSLAAGAIGGLGYLAKASFLPVFVVLTLLVLLLRGASTRTWRPNLGRACMATCGFLVVALPWVLVLSAKEQHLTLGSSAAYNLAIIGPGYDSLSVAHPQETSGLVPPPMAGATSAWTDPTTLPVPTWSPLTSSGLAHELRNVALNVLVSGNWLVRFWVASPLVLLWGLMVLFRRGRDGSAEETSILTAAALVLVGVYLPWLVESRYLWSAFVVTAVLGALWWSRVSRSGRPSRSALLVLGIGTTLLVAQPVHHLASREPVPGHELISTTNELRALGVRGRIASTESSSWARDLYLSYHLGASYYGKLAPDLPATESSAQLRAAGIDYVLEPVGSSPQTLEGFKVLATLPDADLVVLRADRD